MKPTSALCLLLCAASICNAQVRYGGRTYRAPVCNSAYCPMCNAIRAGLQQQVAYSPGYTVVNPPVSRVTTTVAPTTIPLAMGSIPVTQDFRPLARPVTDPNPEQAVLPHSVVTDALAALDLTRHDTYCDIGCGDGRLLVAAVRRYRCRAIGLEIDPAVADQARRNIRQAEEDGLVPTGSIIVHTMDAKDFDPTANRVTAATAFLFPSTLQVLSPVLDKVPRLAVPFHQIPNRYHSTKYKDIYVYGSGVKSERGT